MLREMTRWVEGAGERYAARFDSLEATGADVHGEATLCESLVPTGSRVLDAGCGTGRVAIRLHQRGYRCVGVDLDASMLDVARSRAPEVRWVLADLTGLELAEEFDLVVAAGNVLPFVAAGSEATVVARFADHLGAEGALVAGFGLDDRHLPREAGRVTLDDYDRWCADAGLVLARRLATWEGLPYDGGGYALSIHRRS